MTITINSGAINTVPFPGAEEGSSLVELIGEVIVTCAISSVTLIVTAGAATEPSAVTSSPTARIRSQIGASTTAQVVAGASALSRVPALPSPETGSAIVSPVGIRLSVKASASTTGSAPGAVGSYVRTTRSASTVAASTASASALKRNFNGANTTAQAATYSANALRKIRLGATTKPEVTSAVAIAVAYRTGASTVASAPGTAYSRRSLPVSASTTTTSAGAATAYYRRLAFPDVQAAAAVANAGVLSKVFLSAAVEPVAITSAGVRLTSRLSASVEAGALAISAAADYAIAAPAPEERLMFVPASDRRMEVAP